MNNITFASPEYFLLFIPLGILFLFIYQKNNRKKCFRFLGDIQKIYGTNSLYFKLYYIVLFLIASLFVFIFANLLSQNHHNDINKEGIDIHIVLDTSYSMLANDLVPNRLEVSKKFLLNFIKKLKTDRVGVTIFAGKPFTSLPLNFNYNITNKIIARTSIDTINQNYAHMQGTAIGDALLLAGDSFDNDDDREKVIILLTDGVANKGLAPLVAAKYLKTTYKEQIKMYAIGLGGLERTYIELQNGFGGSDKIEIEGLDEKTLKQMVETVSGQYFRATDNSTLENIFDTIHKLEKKDIKIDSFVVKNEKNIYFIFPLLGLFLILFVIIIRKNV